MSLLTTYKMSFKQHTETAGKSFDPVPAGSQIARCYSIIDLGTQPGSDMYPTPKRKLILTFEIPSLMQVFDESKGEQPRVIGKEYTISFGDKANLGNDMQAWFSDKTPDGDMQSWLEDETIGRAAMLTVAHKKAGNGNTYANIVGISPMPDGIEAKEQINPSMKFDMFGEFDQEKFDMIPEWIQNKIKNSPEYANYQKVNLASPNGELADDDLPF